MATPGSPSVSRAASWLNRLELGAALALIGLPAALLMADRWAGRRQELQWLREVGGGLLAGVESLGLPAYIGLVIACLVGLLLLAVLAAQSTTLAQEFLVPLHQPPRTYRPVSPRQRRWATGLIGVAVLATALLTVRALAAEQLLGLDWGLAALGILCGLLGLLLPWKQVQTAWRQQAGPWGAMGLALLGLLALLASLYSSWLPVWLTAGLMLLAALNLWRYRAQVPLVFWLVAGAVVFFSWDINAWWLVAVGDEFAFYREARFIVYDAPFRLVIENFFKGNYVYSAHPFLSTLLQAVFFKVFGDSNFAWRMSSLFYAAVSLFFFHYFFQTVLQKRYALAATFLLATSHYLAAFGKVGYNNLQALLAFALVLAAAAWALRTRSPGAHLALGLAQAFCFYVYPAALYVAPLPYLLLLLYDPPFNSGAVQRWALSLGALILLLLPLLMQPDYWDSKVAGTLAYTPTLVEDSAHTLSHFNSNFVYSLLSPLFAIEERHFVAGGYLDPLTAMLSFLGLALLLATFWRSRFLLFWLAAFGLVFFLAGMSHDRQFPPSTRMFLLLPFLAVLACLALAWLKLRLSQLTLRSSWLPPAAGLLALLILGLNFYQAHPLAQQRMTGYQGFEGLFLRTSRDFWQSHPDAPILIVHQPETLHIDSLTEILAIYQVSYSEDQVRGITPAELQTGGQQQIAAGAETLVLVDARLPEEDMQAANAALRDLGKTGCPVQHALGDTRLYLWHSAALAAQCPALVSAEG
ncbi:MAG: glycosyltransferase family 39 protein [Anaerolineales bacterium]|nr:glycosyltransferase family 39 protein [Anaerolineales bacterium]MCW5854480.1 glycosyltransferase family 39 protein [Anaerolineales bacterium]